MAPARQYSLIASDGSDNTNASKLSKNCLSNLGPKIMHCWTAESGESRACSVEKNLRRVKLSNEIYCTINVRDFCFLVNLVTFYYISISEVVVKTYWSNATTAKIWNLRNFCQKLQVSKIGSSVAQSQVNSQQMAIVCRK